MGKLVDFVNRMSDSHLMVTDMQIDTFRHFNRFYTNYLGLLNGSLYDRPVNLSEARILYELDACPGSSASDLSDRLALDKGYLSRMLKQFIRKGWVETSSAPDDARIRELRLTESGAMFMEQLHGDAMDQARDALADLSDEDRARLLEAMGVIETVLSRSTPPLPKRR